METVESSPRTELMRQLENNMTVVTKALDAMNLPDDTSSCSDDNGRDSQSPQRPGTVYDFDDDDDENLRTPKSQTPSVRSALGVAVDVHATLSRAALMSLRPNDANTIALPDYRLVAVQPCNVVPRTLSMLSAGDRVQNGAVWQQIASGWTMLPGVEMDDVRPKPCFLGCSAQVRVGVPVIHFLHVCDTAGEHQHVQLSVHIACDPCTRARTQPMTTKNRVRHPLCTVPRTFVVERMTVFLSFVIGRLQEVAARYRVDVVRPPARCDSCSKEMTNDSPTTIVTARRRATDELMVFVMCSARCEAEFRSMIEERLRPVEVRGLNGATLEQPYSNPALPEVRLHPKAYDDPTRDLQLMSAQDVDRMIQSRSQTHEAIGIPLGTVVHRCQNSRCFCRDTHRGHTRRDNNQLDDTFLLEQIYDSFVKYHLYTDILGSRDDARCVGCKSPCSEVCKICLAVRFCGPACQQKFPAAASAHRVSCRPYADAWTPLQLR